VNHSEMIHMGKREVAAVFMVQAVLPVTKPVVK
jgi:hypothetical protein